MKRHQEFFELKPLAHYRDLVLTFIAWIGLMWGIVVFLEPGPISDFDRSLSIYSLVVAVVCSIISPRRVAVFGAAVGLVAVQAWFSFVVTFGDIRALSVAVVATVVVTLIVYLNKARPF